MGIIFVDVKHYFSAQIFKPPILGAYILTILKLGLKLRIQRETGLWLKLGLTAI